MTIYRLTLLLSTLLSLLLIFNFLNSNSVTTINYFPIDKNANFIFNKTKLNLLMNNDEFYHIQWNSSSKTNEPIYLRQDVALLFDSGIVRGVRSKWVQDEQEISFNEDIYGIDNSLFQSISYHHGEIHHPDGQITSIQRMSDDYLYVVSSLNYNKLSFKQPKLKWEYLEKKRLDQLKNQQLIKHWDKLIKYFNLSVDQYTLVPLTELAKYNNKPIDSFTPEQTAQIIGQLWEGLYKNYLIPLINSEPDNFSNLMPVILISNDRTHLLVLFELNNRKEQLIQQLDF